MVLDLPYQNDHTVFCVGTLAAQRTGAGFEGKTDVHRIERSEKEEAIEPFSEHLKAFGAVFGFREGKEGYRPSSKNVENF